MADQPLSLLQQLSRITPPSNQPRRDDGFGGLLQRIAENNGGEDHRKYTTLPGEFDEMDPGSLTIIERAIKYTKSYEHLLHLILNANPKVDQAISGRWVEFALHRLFHSLRDGTYNAVPTIADQIVFIKQLIKYNGHALTEFHFKQWYGAMRGNNRPVKVFEYVAGQLFHPIATLLRESHGPVTNLLEWALELFDPWLLGFMLRSGADMQHVGGAMVMSQTVLVNHLEYIGQPPFARFATLIVPMSVITRTGAKRVSLEDEETTLRLLCEFGADPMLASPIGTLSVPRISPPSVIAYSDHVSLLCTLKECKPHFELNHGTLFLPGFFMLGEGSALSTDDGSDDARMIVEQRRVGLHILITQFGLDMTMVAENEVLRDSYDRPFQPRQPVGDGYEFMKLDQWARLLNDAERRAIGSNGGIHKGDTALHVAARDGNASGVQYLLGLKNRADVNHLNSRGMSPLMVFLWRFRHYYLPCLVMAIFTGDEQTTERRIASHVALVKMLINDSEVNLHGLQGTIVNQQHSPASYINDLLQWTHRCHTPNAIAHGASSFAYAFRVLEAAKEAVDRRFAINAVGQVAYKARLPDDLRNKILRDML